jgi:succinate-semialdehyde dehydrogenase / glutarate-semialdehyde dehydrogenase
MTFTSRNPATGVVEATIDAHGPEEVERRLLAAAIAAPRWRATPLASRLAVLARAAGILESETDHHAHLIMSEMGKLFAAARDEVLKCATACRFYADNAERLLAPERVDIDGETAYVACEPIGVVLAIMPWNFPYWQVMRFAAPALAAGNVGLLKHASNVPRCALAIEDLFARAGAPEGVFQTLLIGSKDVAGVLADARVAAATLTGSEGAGSEVAATAGRHIKKTVLELGGSDPFIVMPSADMTDAVATAVRARTINTGQSCIAAKRFIVHEAVADRFEQEFVAAMAALKVGPPDDPASDVGPLSSERQLEEVEAQVAESVSAGARILIGGKRVGNTGCYFAPTVLTDVPAGSPAERDEIFGPVASLFRVASVDEAIERANSTRFGLGASAWTSDDAEIERFALEIESGLVFVNAMVASDPRLPFGGVKASGYGRELGAFGLREFTNVKTVRIRRSPAKEPHEASE